MAAGQSGFYYTRYPAPGEVPDGEEHYHRAIYFHTLGTDPAADPLVYQPARKEYWPGVSVSPDGRWLLVGVARTFDQTDLYLGDRSAGGAAPPLVPVAEGLAASFDGEVAHGRLFLRTNLDAPTYRLYEVNPEHPSRGHWRELVPPRPDAVLEGVRVLHHQLALSYLERASSRLRLTDLDGGLRREVALPTLGSLFGVGGEWDGDELFFGFSSYTVRRASTGSTWRATSRRSGGASRPTSTRSASRSGRSTSSPGTAHRCPCSSCTSAGSRARATRRSISPATAASTSA